MDVFRLKLIGGYGYATGVERMVVADGRKGDEGLSTHFMGQNP